MEKVQTHPYILSCKIRDCQWPRWPNVAQSFETFDEAFEWALKLIDAHHEYEPMEIIYLTRVVYQRAVLR